MDEHQPPALCEACLQRPVFGLLTLTTDEADLIAAWWTCAECADHDAPIHSARGLRVAVYGSFASFDSAW